MNFLFKRFYVMKGTDEKPLRPSELILQKRKKTTDGAYKYHSL